jgi:cytochrome c peroxidase
MYMLYFSGIVNARVCRVLILCGLLLCLYGCPDPGTGAKGGEEDIVQIPEGFPALPVPVDNPLSSARRELGRSLFYEKKLSRDGSLACASCHMQQFAFTDAGKAVSRGIGGEAGTRNSPTIVNSAYHPVLFFDGRANSLEEQALAAITNPNEMAASHALIESRISADPAYKNSFAKAFGDTLISARRIAMAISTFTRTVLSGNSPFDSYRRGNQNALNQQQIMGMNLFFSSRTKCAECHGGPDFSDYQYHSTGLYTHYYDKGRYTVTLNNKDIGTFKTPTLRNIALTWPYMHDGSVETLEQVMEHYNHGGKPFVNKDSRIDSLHLSRDEVNALIAFMHALTDSSLLVNKRFSQP